MLRAAMWGPTPSCREHTIGVDVEGLGNSVGVSASDSLTSLRALGGLLVRLGTACREETAQLGKHPASV